MLQLDERERVFSRLTPSADCCWLWTGATTRAGYGNIRVGGRTTYAHRAVYEIAYGPISDGLVLDHLCRVRNCVRPDHLEPVAMGENTRRGRVSSGRQGRCPAGHDLTDADNVYMWRGQSQCRQCRRVHTREAMRRYRARKGVPV